MSINYTPRTWVAGEVVTAAFMNTEIRDYSNGVQAAWSAYTPTWVNVTIGNAVVVARSQTLGKTIIFRIAATGGTTTSAAGAVSVSLPAQAHASGNQEVFGIYFNGGAAAVCRMSITAGATVGAVSFGAPLAAVTVFANGSALQFNGAYESA